MKFKPVVRFAVMSDCHYDENHPEYRNRVRETIKYLYEYSESQQYGFLDALYVVGDFTNRGTPEQMQWFAEDVFGTIKEGTKLVVTVANHEQHYVPDHRQSLKNFKELFKMDFDRHEVINGYHFISVSGTQDKGVWHDSFTDEKKEFLKNELEKARNDTKNMPIFVFQHVGIPGTVEGGWDGHDEIYHILSDYPQIIDFSGHSHTPVNDPREINQKNFTCVGTGSMAYLSTRAKRHDHHISGDVSLGEGHANMIVVEADEKGYVRILGLDTVENKFIADNYIIDCHDKSKYQYTLKRAINAPIPYFDEGAKAMVKAEAGKVIVTFPAAKCEKERVKEYCIRFFDKKGTVVGQKTVYSDFMHYTQKEIFTVEAEWIYDFVPQVEIYALGFWENISKPINGTN